MRCLCRFGRAVFLLILLSCASLYTTQPRYRRFRQTPRLKPAVPSQPTPARHPMDAYRGRLSWPVTGTVISGFGLQVDPKYGTKVKNSGIDISCAKGSPVRAVWEGTVSYADVFMGQGLMLILEHGGGYYSVYSRLSEFRVRAGEKVKTGAVLGLSGELLHFELRIGGKAVDPLEWLEKR
ncbi:MAG: peptidoglycan DD-metalloendopeptidase family protein [candidate division WOR-3 bacterium]|uniref:M23ase beta-sheet core domain-containing protein n=1 Tax=candidate division WOR-3 bacterium TaxID=2052148 RepID=A0A7C1SIX9_UNCW3|nr:peptidoglycan DD-metalloendopeptidase family protein [candidate division WOR-3 bacterium]